MTTTLNVSFPAAKAPAINRSQGAARRQKSVAGMVGIPPLQSSALSGGKLSRAQAKATQLVGSL